MITVVHLRWEGHATCRVWEMRELPGRDPLARKIVVPFPVESPLSGESPDP